MPLQTKALPFSRIENPVTRFLALFVAALGRHRQRATLARLDSHLLKDIGIDPVTAAAEIAKPFWQA